MAQLVGFGTKKPQPLPNLTMGVYQGGALRTSQADASTRPQPGRLGRVFRHETGQAMADGGGEGR